ncbi:MAG: hypothetical protein AAGA26_10820 [Pseudomonadota bacterium]
MISPQNRKRLCLIALFVGFVSPFNAQSIANELEGQVELRLNRVESYMPDFPVKREMNARYRPELDRLLSDMHARMNRGENMSCSSQIFEEVHWLVNYTDRVDEIERRMDDLRASFEMEDQGFASRQDPDDGSFAPCAENWLWRFFRSVDPLKELAQKGQSPEVPLKIWEPVDTPAELEAFMMDLLVSDVSSGHNKRKELNLAITAIGQLLWLDYTARVFPDHLDREELAEALRRFVDEEWQDPDSGYWGAWFLDEGVVKRTNDLSITFHILSYRGGDVSLKSKIGQTTMAIQRVRYPYGWSTGGTQNNHHAYDIARIINLTWDDMDEPSRQYGSATIFLMSARSLAKSIDSTGAFDPKPYTTVGEAYYFGISFFEEIGLFGNPIARQSLTRVSDTGVLYRQISGNLDKLDQSDPWVAAARRKLNGIKPAE